MFEIFFRPVGCMAAMQKWAETVMVKTVRPPGNYNNFSVMICFYAVLYCLFVNKEFQSLFFKRRNDNIE